MAEEEGAQTRQKSDSYPSPRSHPSPSIEILDTSTQEQGKEDEQDHDKKSRLSTQNTEISASTLTNPLPSDNRASLNHQQNGLHLSPQVGEHRQQLEQGRHELPQTQHKEQQQDARQSPVVATVPAVVTATQPKLNTQPNSVALPMNAYFSQSTASPGSQMAVSPSSQSTTLRYPLTSHSADERIIAGGRNRKEVKRRTKTGCLTCRKRRIKVIKFSYLVLTLANNLFYLSRNAPIIHMQRAWPNN